jgi:hypothetical protein
MQDCEDWINGLARALKTVPVDLALVREAVQRVLEWLVEPGHDTDENCRRVEALVLLRVLDDDGAVSGMKALPGHLRRIIEDMGMLLHDAHSAPEIAEMFDSTPRQLLTRLNEEPDGSPRR